MPILSRVTSLLRNLFQRRRSDEALDAEVHGYVDMLADEKIRAGMNPEDARRAARIELGGVEQTKEQVREVRAGAWLEILVQDLRYGVRTLGRSAGSTVIAVLTLALGIGANTAIFSVIDTALLRPLPYPNPDRIAMLYARSPNGETGELSPADFLDYKNELQSFEYLAGIRESSFNLAGEDRPERVAGTVVTPEFFAVMGRRAQIGRTLIPEQDKPSASRTMVLSYSLWQHRFGGDPAILGRSVYVDNIPRIVVGVMPHNFQFPGESGLWLSALHAVPDQPLNPAADLSADRDSHYFDAIGRLRPGVNLRQAETEAATIARRLKQQFPHKEAGGAAVIFLHEDLVGQTRPAMLILLGAVSLLLLIACANVASIQLARGASRQRELSIRKALGASRTRLVRQLLTECVLLAVAGGGIGILLADFGLVPLRALIPRDVLGGAQLALDVRVLAFTILASLGSAILFGLLPALHLANPDLIGILKEAGHGAGSSSRAQQIRRVLVVSEIALAAMLLIGAALLIRSFHHLLSAPEGFRPRAFSAFSSLFLRRAIRIRMTALSSYNKSSSASLLFPVSHPRQRSPGSLSIPGAALARSRSKAARHLLRVKTLRTISSQLLTIFRALALPSSQAAPSLSATSRALREPSSSAKPLRAVTGLRKTLSESTSRLARAATTKPGARSSAWWGTSANIISTKSPTQLYTFRTRKTRGRSWPSSCAPRSIRRARHLPSKPRFTPSTRISPCITCAR